MGKGFHGSSQGAVDFLGEVADAGNAHGVGPAMLAVAEHRHVGLGRGAAIDRLPCVPIVGNTSARVAGVKVSAFRGDGRLMAEAQIASYRRFGYDSIRVFTDLYTQAEAMGAVVRYPDDETAFLEPPATRGLADPELRPADPLRDGNLPAHLEAAARVLDAVGKEVPVTVALTGPFTTASCLVGTENLVRLTLHRPEAVHRLCGRGRAATLRICGKTGPI